MTKDKRRDELPEQLHQWYLEATMNLHKQSFNPLAQKPYKDLTSEQKYIDQYIAEQIIAREKKMLEDIEKKTVDTINHWRAGHNDMIKLYDLLATINKYKGE